MAPRPGEHVPAPASAVSGAWGDAGAALRAAHRLRVGSQIFSSAERLRVTGRRRSAGRGIVSAPLTILLLLTDGVTAALAHIEGLQREDDDELRLQKRAQAADRQENPRVRATRGAPGLQIHPFRCSAPHSAGLRVPV